MLHWLYPVKTGHTAVDVWTLFHLAFWVFMGSNFWVVRHALDLKHALILGLVLSYAWELFERWAEPRWPHVWLTPESWVNAYVSDPLTSVVGILFAWYALEHWR